MRIVFTISFTANLFLGFLLYGFAFGHLARTIPVISDADMAKQLEADSLTNYAKDHPAKPVRLSRN